MDFELSLWWPGFWMYISRTFDTFTLVEPERNEEHEILKGALGWHQGGPPTNGFNGDHNLAINQKDCDKEILKERPTPGNKSTFLDWRDIRRTIGFQFRNQSRFWIKAQTDFSSPAGLPSWKTVEPLILY